MKAAFSNMEKHGQRGISYQFGLDYTKKLYLYNIPNKWQLKMAIKQYSNIILFFAIGIIITSCSSGITPYGALRYQGYSEAEDIEKINWAVRTFNPKNWYQSDEAINALILNRKLNGKQKINLINQLVKKGVTISSLNVDVAYTQNEPEIIRYLVGQGAFLNDRQGEIEYFLFYASEFSFDERIEKLRTLIPADFNANFQMEEYDLVYGYLKGKGLTVLEQGFGVSYTALGRSDELAIVKFLVSKGADPNFKNSKGNNAIEQQAIRGNADIVEYLLTRPTKYDTKNSTSAPAKFRRITTDKGIKTANKCEYESLDPFETPAANIALTSLLKNPINSLSCWKALEVLLKNPNNLTGISSEAVCYQSPKIIEYLIQRGALDHILDQANSELAACAFSGESRAKLILLLAHGLQIPIDNSPIQRFNTGSNDIDSKPGFKKDKKNYVIFAGHHIDGFFGDVMRKYTLGHVQPVLFPQAAGLVMIDLKSINTISVEEIQHRRKKHINNVRSSDYLERNWGLAQDIIATAYIMSRHGHCEAVKYLYQTKSDYHVINKSHTSQPHTAFLRHEKKLFEIFLQEESVKKLLHECNIESRSTLSTTSILSL